MKTENNHLQQAYFKTNAARLLDKLLKKNRVKRLFLVVDKAVWEKSEAIAEYASLLGKYKVARFDSYSANPKLPDAKRGVAYFKKNPSDLILAIGGGSTIDMAKIIAALESEREPFEKIISDVSKTKRRRVPLIAMPTTAGSGSEATHFAVIYHRGNKYSLAHPSLLPDFAIMDASFLLSCPLSLAATSGADALCHAIEAYWSVNSTPLSKRYSSYAINIILKYLKSSVTKGDLSDCEYMARAAHSAGKAINISKTTTPHALSYLLTSKFGIPHGQAASVFLPLFIAYNDKTTAADNRDPRGAAYLKRTMGSLYHHLNVHNVIQACQTTSSLLNSVSLKANLAELGLQDRPLINKLISTVNIERLNNNPRLVTPKILQLLLTGKTP